VNFSVDVANKISKLIADGMCNLHVIADFDKTLTVAFIDGKKHQSSYALLRDYGYLPEAYSTKARAEWEHFYPIEIDSKLSVEQKFPHMQEWWSNHWNLFIDYKITEAQLKTIVADGKVYPRKNLDVFFDVLHSNKIPTLIFSAGMGNIIQIFLEQEDFLKDNVHIISNFLEMTDGVATSFKKPLIHVFNKNESVIKDSQFTPKVLNRKNVLLLGDSLADIDMANGFDHDCVLKIGFLNDKVEERRAQFNELFDIVLEGDGSMQPVIDILDQILSK
jgi:HAD superfamily hydrolase (TIGR01544 family)